MDDTQKQNFELICTIIAEEMDVNAADIDEDTTLADDLDMNRDNIRQVLIACEMEFDIHYESEDYEDIRTVGDILASLNVWGD
ncbi:MAG: acyl carrier protein [Lachnospiraceae bacterium]|nr:acyl carrier protein [Lachnospiraceae bacterium]